MVLVVSPSRDSFSCRQPCHWRPCPSQGSLPSMTDHCRSVKTWSSWPTSEQLWWAILAPELHLRLAVAVTWVCISAHVLLCRVFLTSFPSSTDVVQKEFFNFILPTKLWELKLWQWHYRALHYVDLAYFFNFTLCHWYFRTLLPSLLSFLRLC